MKAANAEIDTLTLREAEAHRQKNEVQALYANAKDQLGAKQSELDDAIAKLSKQCFERQGQLFEREHELEVLSDRVKLLESTIVDQELQNNQLSQRAAGLEVSAVFVVRVGPRYIPAMLTALRGSVDTHYQAELIIQQEHAQQSETKAVLAAETLVHLENRSTSEKLALQQILAQSQADADSMREQLAAMVRLWSAKKYSTSNSLWVIARYHSPD